MSKLNVGSKAYIFNSLSMRIEEDVVYGVLYVPVAVEGHSQSADKSISEKLESGEMVVKEQYQLVSHQGIIDADVVFGSEEGCKEYYKIFFAD